MIIAETSFRDAVKEFKRILADNNLPGDLVWLFKDDMLVPKRHNFKTDYLVSLTDITRNNDLAEQCYEIAKNKGFGVELKAFATWPNRIGCAVILPKDELDAQYRLMSPSYIKFTFLCEMSRPCIIDNWLKWQLTKTFYHSWTSGCPRVDAPPKNLQFYHN
jgi:hypothetical protein